ncbi:MAG: cystathionine gamma-synthase [Dermatophilus congolensis]|nr:cystathionine gamma-synthase [Dermatophilus congolensis]
MTEISPLTRAIRADIETDSTHGAVIAPIYMSTNYAFEGFDQPRKYDYTRCGNPTRDVLAEALTTLEGGAGGIVTASGLAAITNLLIMLTKVGDRIVIPHDCYGGTWRLFDSLAERGYFTYDLVDFTDEVALRECLAQEPAPAVVWIETPSNPLMRVTDIRAVADAAHAVGATVVADNTFLTPILQRPLEHGADYVTHSTTKYINGHSDVVAGAVIASTDEGAEQLAWWANVIGVPGSPFDSYLTMRGVRSLASRLRTHQENAAAVVDVVRLHDAVESVYYPGLADHPGQQIISRQQDGPGAMLSFDLRGGVPAVKAFVDGLQCFSLAESLGGAESLVAHPATMTHASMTEEVREAAGIGAGLLRISVGIEHADDLVADVRAALDRAAAAS